MFLKVTKPDTVFGNRNGFGVSHPKLQEGLTPTVDLIFSKINSQAVCIKSIALGLSTYLHQFFHIMNMPLRQSGNTNLVIGIFSCK